VQKDPEVLKLLEEDEDDFEEFEEDGTFFIIQHTTVKTFPPKSNPNSGGKTGTMRTSTTSSQPSSKRNLQCDFLNWYFVLYRHHSIHPSFKKT
jgi:hypothetical protein